MLGNIYGLDLGTYEIKVYDKRKIRFGQRKMPLPLRTKTLFFLWVMRRMRCTKKRRII